MADEPDGSGISGTPGVAEALPRLRATGITKRYGSVRALADADFEARPGEVTAMVGDNGAGKSTLVKCLSGVERPDSGEIVLDERAVTLDSPSAAQRLGIETVHQDLSLAFDLAPPANLFLGREILRPGLLGLLGVLDNGRMAGRAAEDFRALGVSLSDGDAPVRTLSGGQRQSVAVARAVAWASKVIFMDEPTAALGVVQRERVLDVMRRVRDTGIAVVLISHNMPEVLAVADRIEVLRLGRRVARFHTGAVSVDDLVAAMTGSVAGEHA